MMRLYKLLNNLENTDRKDLISLIEDGDRWIRGHSKKIRKIQGLRNIKKFIFPHRTVDISNSLRDAIVTAESVHKFKENLEKTRYGDKSL